MVLPKLPCIWGEGGVSTPYRYTKKSYQLINTNVWPGSLVSPYVGISKDFSQENDD
jgi:hypothetical protein